MTGNRIKQLREHFGLSQNDLAKKAGLGRATIARIEKNDGKTKTDTLEKIAQALNITVNELLPNKQVDSQNIKKSHKNKEQSDIIKFYDTFILPDIKNMEGKILSKLDEEIDLLKEMNKKIDELKNINHSRTNDCD
ncbi:MAG: helix-turn-helix domain-containing protein [Candidatus Xenobiia bacterium LiM19]